MGNPSFNTNPRVMRVKEGRDWKVRKRDRDKCSWADRRLLGDQGTLKGSRGNSDKKPLSLCTMGKGKKKTLEEREGGGGGGGFFSANDFPVRGGEMDKSSLSPEAAAGREREERFLRVRKSRDQDGIYRWTKRRFDEPKKRGGYRGAKRRCPVGGGGEESLGGGTGADKKILKKLCAPPTGFKNGK